MIVFNGEIYNAPDLKKEIVNRFPHIVFSRKNADTEVLLNSYIAFHLEMFEKIEGMFAFIIVDLVKSKIIISRDHFGQKPLHYSRIGDHLTISSELTPIKILYKNKLHTDPLGLAKFLAYDSIPAPRTLYREVRQLCPATYMEFDLKTLKETKQKRYWSPTFNRGHSSNLALGRYFGINCKFGKKMYLIGYSDILIPQRRFGFSGGWTLPTKGGLPASFFQLGLSRKII